MEDIETTSKSLQKIIALCKAFCAHVANGEQTTSFPNFQN
jgi:hypothetical protein